MEIFLIILFMGLVTYLPRIIPLIVLSRLNLPTLLLEWLSFLPVAILGALLLPLLIMPEGELFISLQNPFLLASVPTFLVAFKTKNLLLTVLLGMIFVVLLTL